ncbi:MAG: hypothetical protein V1886_03200 [archaeon]
MKLSDKFLGFNIIEVITISAVILGSIYGLKAADKTHQKYLSSLESQGALAPNSLEVENRKNKNGKIETILMYEKPVGLLQERNNPVPMMRIEKDKEGRWSATPLDYKK